jgi:zinc transporter ZupT
VIEPALPYALGVVGGSSLLYVAVADLIPGLHRKVGHLLRFSSAC